MVAHSHLYVKSEGIQCTLLASEGTTGTWTQTQIHGKHSLNIQMGKYVLGVRRDLWRVFSYGVSWLELLFGDWRQDSVFLFFSTLTIIL